MHQTRNDMRLDGPGAAVSLKSMKTVHAAFASLSLLLVSHVAHAQEATADEQPEQPQSIDDVPSVAVADSAGEPTPGEAPATEATPADKTLIGSTDPRSHADPRDDAAPTGFAPPLSPAIAPPAKAATAQSDKPADSPADPRRGPLGMFRLGALAGAGFPSAVSGQLVLKFADWVGATASYGATPAIPIPVADSAHVAQHGFSATGRVYPFRGDFFLGFGGGTSTMTGDVTQSQSGITGKSNVRTSTAYVMPELGILHRFSFGLAIGADIGVQLPVSAHTETTASANGSAQPTPADLRDAMTKLGTTPIPVINFLRLGWVI